MHTELIPFAFEGRPVRVVTDAQGEPWFVAADVCAALHLPDTHKAVARLDDDEKARNSIPTLGGEQEMTVVNEPGLLHDAKCTPDPAGTRPGPRRRSPAHRRGRGQGTGGQARHRDGGHADLHPAARPVSQGHQPAPGPPRLAASQRSRRVGADRGRHGLGHGKDFLISGDLMMETLLRNEDAIGNGAESAILMGAPYSVRVVIEGVADLLFHRWNCETVDAKAKAAKNSATKKTDDIESYRVRSQPCLYLS